MKQFTAQYESPLGCITLFSDGDALTGLKFEKATAGHETTANLTVFAETSAWLDRYFQGQKPVVFPKMNPEGTMFQKWVWARLLLIPYGKTISYGALANDYTERTGKAMSAQAIGGAVGRNPIPVLIPCHRVIGADGSLTGYAWGVERKAKLLHLESADCPAAFAIT